MSTLYGEVSGSGGGGGISVVVVVVTAAPWWQDEANSLDDLAAVERTFVQQVRTFDARTHVATVEEQHGRLQHHTATNN